MKHGAQPVLRKTIFQARFKPALCSLSVLPSTAQMLSGYPDWNAEWNSITLSDFPNHCNITITPEVITYDQDSSNVQLETARIEAALETIPPAMKLEKFARIGFRRKYLIALEMTFDELVTILQLKLQNADERLAAALPPRLEDIMFRIDSADDENRFHIQLGPLRKMEVINNVAPTLESNFNPKDRNEQLRSLFLAAPETSVIIDIDVYRMVNESTVKDAKEFVKSARQKTDSISTGLADYLFEEKIKS